MTFFLGVSPAYQPTPVAQLPELRELELIDWDCLQKPEGAAKTQDGKEPNVQKNRSAIEFTGINIPSFDTATFLARVAEYGRQIGRKHRRELTSAPREQETTLEKQVLSLTVDQLPKQRFSRLAFGVVARAGR